MKLVIEIPDKLLRRIEGLAAAHKTSLNEEISLLLEAGLSRPRIPYELKGGYQLTAEEIRAAINEGRK